MRPSIAALQSLIAEPDSGDEDEICRACHAPSFVPADLEPSALCHPCAQEFVAVHGPVLLEIVAAALAEQSTACDCDGESRCDDDCSALRAALAYHAALAKVRP